MVYETEVYNIVTHGSLFQSKAGDVKEAVKSAIRAGYRHIDCAMIYGNESEVGAGLTEVMQEGLVTRKELFIVSKVGAIFVIVSLSLSHGLLLRAN